MRSGWAQRPSRRETSHTDNKAQNELHAWMCMELCMQCGAPTLWVAPGRSPRHPDPLPLPQTDFHLGYCRSLLNQPGRNIPQHDICFDHTDFSSARNNAEKGILVAAINPGDCLILGLSFLQLVWMLARILCPTFAERNDNGFQHCKKRTLNVDATKVKSLIWKKISRIMH